MKDGAMLATLALALIALVYAQLLIALRRVEGVAVPAGESPPPPSWWFGYARDGANMFGFLGFSGGFAIGGMDGPSACLAGASLALCGYGLDYLLARTLPPERAPLLFRLLLVALAAAASALREPIARGLRAVVEVMF
jgi:hypothetical protein